MSAAKFLAELRHLHTHTKANADRAIAAGLAIEGVTVDVSMDVDRLGTFLDGIDAVHQDRHDLANRCAAAEGILAEFVEWHDTEHHVGDVRADAQVLGRIIGQMEETVEAARQLLAARKGAKVDHPGRDASGVAVDGGGAREGSPRPPLPPPSPYLSAEDDRRVTDWLNALAPAVRAQISYNDRAALMRLIAERRDAR